ncbi:MAG: serine/threonine-protein kinase [Candidatus Moeniiplasma glomeromycotorum]|nr:serine/threonine-protein kinase [Candidatus Moeniiplasma glomeromycotorum]MCE8167569.1 serine/threonine-protein kinase [Candidatus Moeniiplasma glomeromycotorum]MCE8169079.1 serine/threonine-protein kinase [Candidatus Moeniiplasma glomeromycotorum]
MTNWKEIHKDFTEELRKEWISKNIRYEECKAWIDIGLDPTDANYAAWLESIRWKDRDNKQLEAKIISYLESLENKQSLSLSNKTKTNIKRKLKTEYNKSEYKKWVDIHKNFSYYYQDEWKKLDFTYQTAKSWIEAGLEPENHDLVIYARWKGYQFQQIKKGELKKEYENWKENPPAQEYLDFTYPCSERKQIRELELNAWNEGLTGELNLNDFTNLEKLNCFLNQLTFLNLSKCSKLVELNCNENNLNELDVSNCLLLEKLDCRDNELTNLQLNPNAPLRSLSCQGNQLANYDFLQQINSEQLTRLSLSNNRFFAQDLTIFSHFSNLKELDISNNRFFGSLKPLQNMTDLEQLNIANNRISGSLEFLVKLEKLEYLDIGNTDLNGGVEYLPSSLSGISKNGYKKISYNTKEGSASKVQEISQQLDLFVDERKKTNWKKLDLVLAEVIDWVKIGLTVDDYNFADYLKRKKNLAPQKASGRLEELRIEYNLDWKNIDENFTPELWREWEEKRFSAEEIKEWISAGLKPNDADFSWWLKNVKKYTVYWFMNYGEEEKLREKYEEYTANPKLSAEVIKQLKEKNFQVGSRGKVPWLSSSDVLFIDQLIPNEKLNLRYKEYGLCAECQQPNTGSEWCRTCNAKHFQADFPNWTSVNSDIDKFIQKCQLEAKDYRQTLEWIPYERFTNIEKIGKGGFSEVYKAKWVDGMIIEWNVKNKKWERGNQKIVLKILYNSRNVKTDFLQEVIYHKLVDDGMKMIVSCYGISQDPKTGNYVMIMSREESDLRQYLQKNHSKLDFEDKLLQLYYIAQGLNSIHDKKLIHRDFHAGNILKSHKRCYITDLGLCRPVNETNKEKVYGVLPYIAPEVLRGKKYTQASDIYSFGIIVYEVLSGLPPYHDLAHEEFLAVKICQGLRPNIEKLKVPQLLKDLIKKCWDADPEKRPSAGETCSLFSSDWLHDFWDGISINKNAKLYRQYEEIEIEKFNNFKIWLKRNGNKKLDLEWEEILKERNVDKVKKEVSNLIEELEIDWKGNLDYFEWKYPNYKEYQSCWEAVEQWENETKEKMFYSRQIHPQAIYTSRLIDFKKNLSEPQNGKEINEIFYKTSEELEHLRISDVVKFSKELEKKLQEKENQLELTQGNQLQFHQEIPPK